MFCFFPSKSSVFGEAFHGFGANFLVFGAFFFGGGPKVRVFWCKNQGILVQNQGFLVAKSLLFTMFGSCAHVIFCKIVAAMVHKQVQNR